MAETITGEITATEVSITDTATMITVTGTISTGMKEATETTG